MPIVKIWKHGAPEFGYSDLTGTDKYQENGQPFNYYPTEEETSLDQYSFRFFNDDGNEASATPKASLNVSPSLSSNDKVRIRFLLNALGDPSNKRFKLECQYKPPGQSFGPWETVL